MLHQTDVATGAVTSLRAQRREVLWMFDRTHGVPGTLESTHLEAARHLVWHEAAEGGYRFRLPPPGEPAGKK